MKTLNRTIVITGGLALSGVIIASLAMAGTFGHDRRHGHMFSAASLDRDGDGALTKDEVLAHNRARFDRLDSDGDGAISPDEFGARLVEMFSRMDSDQDGVLAGDELPHRMGKHGAYHGHGYHRGHHNATGQDTGAVTSPDGAS